MKEKYGETLGIEKYHYFGNATPDGEMNQVFEDSGIFRHALYNGEIFYLRPVDGVSCLWRAKADGTEQRVIAEEPEFEFLYSDIFVNHYGIFLHCGSRIRVCDFEGQVKIDLDQEEGMSIQSYYYCDNRIFLIVEDEETWQDIVCWYEIDTGECHHIFTGEKVETEPGNYAQTQLEYIMANNRRAIMWAHFLWYADENPAEAGGWYTYDFETGKMMCFNSSCSPHRLIMSPDEFREDAAWQKIRDEYSEKESSKEWMSIAWFDMENDRMWVRIPDQDHYSEQWVPVMIDYLKDTERINELPVWSGESQYEYETEIYFDGIYWLERSQPSQVLMHHQDGRDMVIAETDFADYDNRFQVCGNDLFFVDSPQEYYQYDMTSVPLCKKFLWSHESVSGSSAVSNNQDNRVGKNLGTASDADEDKENLNEFYYRRGLEARRKGNDQEAAANFGLAMAGGHLEAMNCLASMYLHGRGVEQSLKSAFALFKKAAEGGNTHAQTNLAMCYYLGRGTECNIEEAVRWYQTAAESGSGTAARRLAEHYSKAPYEDSEKRFQWYSRGAELDDADCLFWMARHCLRSGNDQDVQRAEQLLDQAAEKGSAEMKLKVAQVFDGRFQKKAAKPDSKNSETRVFKNSWAFLRKEKNQTPKPLNLEKAAKWYREALKKGDEQICLDAAKGLDEQTEEPVRGALDAQSACDAYRKLASKGYQPAMIPYAECCEKGKGMQQDFAEAIKWYEKASTDEGDMKAQLCMLEMQGVQLCKLKMQGHTEKPASETVETSPRTIKRSMETCGRCGTRLVQGAFFCTQCGASVADILTLEEPQCSAGPLADEVIKPSAKPSVTEKMTSTADPGSVQAAKRAAKPAPTANPSTSAIPADTSKLGYWKAFVAYAFENQSSPAFTQAGFPQAEPADRNWYALRLGSAKTHIEMTFNSKKGTIRTALFTKDSDWFEQLRANEARIERDFSGIPGTITWDGESKSSSVSIIREVADLNRDREEQFDWYMECACILKHIAADYFYI